MRVSSNKLSKGFLIKKQNRVHVAWQKTLSIIQNEILLALVESHAHFMSGQLLDLGCGSRPYELFYATRATCSVGTDIPLSPHRLNIDAYAHGEFLPFKDNAFDTVLCTEVLEHTVDLEKTVSEIRRVLKNKGIIIMSVPFMYPVHEPPFDFLRFTSYGVRNLLDRHGFEILSLKAKGGVISAFVSIIQFVVIGSVHQVLKRTGLSTLMDRSVIRFTFVIHQFVYWFIFRLFFGKKLMTCDTSVSKYENLMSIGYFCVARKTNDISAK